MLGEHKKTLVTASIVTLLPALAGIILWNRLPDRMATHFGLDNQANRFSSKVFAVFGLPVFLLAVEWIVAAVTAGDPKKQNISPGIFTLVLWIVPVCSLICGAAVYSYNLGYRPDITFFMELLMGVLFLVIGSFLPKIRQNYTVGIKIPWTLANEENWDLTHRMAGNLWSVGGLLMLIAGLTKIIPAAGLLVIMIVMTFLPCVYSFWLHLKKGL